MSGFDEYLTDEVIERMFERTDFGPASGTPEGRIGLMVECVIKTAAGYSAGSTITRICSRAGVLTPAGESCLEGLRWACGKLYRSGRAGAACAGQAATGDA